MKERWLPVVGYEGSYSVSNLGRVRSEARLIGGRHGSKRRWPERILRTTCPKITGKGRRYPTVGLPAPNGKQVSVRVQYLVMEAFVGPRPAGLEVLHRDDDPNNNALRNLRYGTHAENKADEVANSTHCRSGKHPWNKKNTYIRPDTKTRICRACIAIAKENRERS